VLVPLGAVVAILLVARRVDPERDEET